MGKRDGDIPETDGELYRSLDRRRIRGRPLHRDDGQCHEVCWKKALAEWEAAEAKRLKK